MARPSTSVGRRRPLLRYHERRPPAMLAAIVSACWSLDVVAPLPAGFVHHVWPDGAFSMVVVGHGRTPVAASIVGPTTSAIQVGLHPGLTYRGLRFRPEAGAATLELEASAMRDRVTSWSEMLGRTFAPDAIASDVAAAESDSDADEVFAAWLGDRTSRVARAVADVRRAVELVHAHQGAIEICDVARAIDVTTRSLQRRFAATVGLSPKAFARVCRGRAALIRVVRRAERWSWIADDMGFADQSHLVRELSRIMGMAPLALEERLSMIEHDLIDDGAVAFVQDAPMGPMRA